MYVEQSGKYVVDCEFHSLTNEIISIAIVPLWNEPSRYFLKPQEEPEREFYEVISPLPENLTDWVKTNVVPYLNKPGIPYAQLQEKLEAFFVKHRVEELHYDWCNDIAIINRLMITGPGQRIKLGGRFLSHTHHPDIECTSKTAHNALEDARALAAAIRERLIAGG